MNSKAVTYNIWMKNTNIFQLKDAQFVDCEQRAL